MGIARNAWQGVGGWEVDAILHYEATMSMRASTRVNSEFLLEEIDNRVSRLADSRCEGDSLPTLVH
jgi:hypothetical protein